MEKENKKNLKSKMKIANRMQHSWNRELYALLGLFVCND